MMVQDDAISRRVGELFYKHFDSYPMVDDITALGAQLPDDPTVLRGLATRCDQESQKIRHAGHHIEGRRFEILSRQLKQRAESIERGSRT